MKGHVLDDTHARQAHQDETHGDAAIETAVEELARWLRSNGIAGWDPYDVLGHPLLVRARRLTARRIIPSRVWRRVDRAIKNHPLGARKALRIKPSVNAKGVGLLLSGWLRAQTLGVEGAEQQISITKEWLLANPSAHPAGVSWGYPFDWQSRVFIPRGTPSSVVTSTCGTALLDYLDMTGDSSVENAARGAAVFLAEGLNRAEDSRGNVCLSYTPLDDFQVHNANLLAAEYLLRASKVFSADSWRQLAESCLHFTLNQQRPDGSFEYWSDRQMSGHQVDNYHTGFVLRSLFAFSEAGSARAKDGLEQGWPFYRDRLLAADRARPRDIPDVDTQLNIHSCAESVLCPAVLSPYFPEARRIAAEKALWTVENMRNSDGSFVHGIFDGRVSRLPYLRWSQAWMFRALTEYLCERPGSKPAS